MSGPPAHRGRPLTDLLRTSALNVGPGGCAMVKPAVAAYLEVGTRRVFAGALDWPGWCRSGRDEDTALRAMVAYGPRYAAAIGPLAQGFTDSTDLSALDIVERPDGNATPDFGAAAKA